MHLRALLAVALSSCLLPAAAQPSEKAFGKAIGAEIAAALKLHREDLQQALALLGAQLQSLEQEVAQGAFGAGDVADLFDALQQHQAAVALAYYEAFKAFDDAATPAMMEFADAGGLDDGYPAAVSPGARKSGLDRFRAGIARNVERALRKARKRVAAAVKRIEAGTDWRLVVQLQPPGRPLDAQPLPTGFNALLNTPLTADLALGASRADVAGDGRAYLGGTAGVYTLNNSPDIEVFGLITGLQPALVDTDTERWAHVLLDLDEQPYMFAAREEGNLTVATIGITVP